MEELIIGGEKIVIDPDKLRFNEANLAAYLEEESGWYNYYGSKLAKAEMILQLLELRYETLYSNKFTEFKANGGSDKLVEAQSKSDKEVEDIARQVIESQYNVKMLALHLRAWDKSHENAQNRSNTLRKEMDKMGLGHRSESLDLEAQLEGIIGAGSRTNN